MGVFKEVDILMREHELLTEEAEMSRQLMLMDFVVEIGDEKKDRVQLQVADPSHPEQEWNFAYWA